MGVTDAVPGLAGLLPGSLATRVLLVWVCRSINVVARGKLALVCI